MPDSYDFDPIIPDKYRTGAMTGWKPDPAHAKRFAAFNRTPVFALASPSAMDAPARDVFLPKYLATACRELYGKDWRYRPQYQRAGSCVGQSSKTGTDIIMAVNRFVGGTKFIGRAAVSAIYAGSRVEIAGQPGRWDGSNGSWAADWLTKYGIVLLKELNLAEDSRDPDENLAVEWAARASGVPAQYETVAKQKPITNAALVQTTAEVRAALNSLCYVNICSSLIPGAQRDADGVSRMSNQGGHSTGIVGCRLVRNEWVYAYCQSWGDWAAGPYGWLAFDPTKEFATTIVDITEGDLSRVLQSRDCYALSGVNVFELVDPLYFL